MDSIRKFLTTVFGMCLSLALAILVMIRGWGLEPKSWFWIIGVGLFGQILAFIIVSIGTWKDKV